MEQRLGVATASAIALAAALALAACQKAGPTASVSTAAGNAVTPVSTAAAPAGGLAAGADSPKAFLDGLYAHYQTSSSTGTTWAPMDANVKDVFDADTVALLAADTKALKGELGDIDGDWLCDCQDWGSLASTVSITSQSPTAAKATAVFHDTQIPDDKPKTDTFDLVKTAAGWRIHDMGTEQDASLRHVLTREIGALKSGASRPLSD